MKKSDKKTKLKWKSLACLAGLVMFFVLGIGSRLFSGQAGNPVKNTTQESVATDINAKPRIMEEVSQEEESTEEIADEPEEEFEEESEEETFSIEDVPAYSGYAYVQMHDNKPYFTKEEEQNEEIFETYSELDDLGRCGVAFANICRELQPTEPRGEIGKIKPSGWHTVKYNDIISDNYLYNRCHLIGYQLAGENANEKNLITGTRYLNVAGMLPFENQITAYLEQNDNHVLYRVTPVFEGDNLVASGVLLEAYSVEDAGAGICFNVYCYNVQPGIAIDYATGDSHEDSSVVAYDNNYDSAIHRDEQEDTASEALTEAYAAGSEADKNASGEKSDMVWISETGNKYHRKNNCGTMNPDNATELTKEQAEDMGYEPCGRCYSVNTME